MPRKKMKSNWILLAWCMISGLADAAKLSYVEQMPLDTFAELRETERYQIKLAEKFYTGEKYKIAADEFEKYLSLYESGAGAPYAQLMWSHCQLKLRKVNTAISDGFSSVVDYWPDSHEAVIAKYMIGYCYLAMGETGKAEKHYNALLADHGDHTIAVKTKCDLVELAKQQGDEEKRERFLRALVFDTTRSKATDGETHWASRELASILFYAGNVPDAIKSLETSYKDGYLLRYVLEYGNRAVYHLTGKDETRAKGERIADSILAFVEKRIPEDIAAEENRKIAKDIWYKKASILGASRKPEKVRATYEQMIKLFGADDGLLGSIAKWYIGNKERAKAKAIYGKFENKARGLGYIAGMLREEGKHEEAIVIYRDLMQIDSENANGYQWSIAECYQDAGKFKEAIHSYREADRYPDAYFRMAGCHRKLKQYREALVLYNQAKSYDGAAPEALLQIGYTYEDYGQREKAIKTFQQVCKLFPKSDRASRAHAHLQNKYKLSVTLGGATDE